MVKDVIPVYRLAEIPKLTNKDAPPESLKIETIYMPIEEYYRLKQEEKKEVLYE